MGLSIVLLNRITITLLATKGRKYLILASPDLGDWNAWSYSLASQHLIVAWKYLLFTSAFWKESPLRRLRREWVCIVNMDQWQIVWVCLMYGRASESFPEEVLICYHKGDKDCLFLV